MDIVKIVSSGILATIFCILDELVYKQNAGNRHISLSVTYDHNKNA